MPVLNLDVSPNPSSAIVNINVQGEEVKDSAVRIVDMLGKTKYSQTLPENGKLMLDVSSWAKGIYLVQVDDDPSMAAKRLVIN